MTEYNKGDLLRLTSRIYPRAEVTAKALFDSGTPYIRVHGLTLYKVEWDIEVLEQAAEPPEWAVIPTEPGLYTLCPKTSDSPHNYRMLRVTGEGHYVLTEDEERYTREEYAKNVHLKSWRYTELQKVPEF